jgi:hypothetical protein
MDSQQSKAKKSQKWQENFWWIQNWRINIGVKQ